jgi:hypothetical protein
MLRAAAAEGCELFALAEGEMRIAERYEIDKPEALSSSRQLWSRSSMEISTVGIIVPPVASFGIVNLTT